MLEEYICIVYHVLSHPSCVHQFHVPGVSSFRLAYLVSVIGLEPKMLEVVRVDR
jgi:hypothetical protein